jgi:hypothetical protein
MPLPDDGSVAAATIRPVGAERVRNHVVLENLTGDEIVANKISGATTMSVADIPAPLAPALRRQAVAAYQLSDTAELTWQRRVREQESGLAASISLADLTTVLHADGRYRARASYNIRNFKLQFLELELPPDSQVWSVHVSGQIGTAGSDRDFVATAKDVGRRFFVEGGLDLLRAPGGTAEQRSASPPQCPAHSQ